MNQSSSVLFTILLPVHRNISLLQYAIKSVLSQTLDSFELFIVCDGASVNVIETAHDFAKKDDRIRVYNFPKGQRFGEAHRHQVLMQASGQFVAHIGDDDLWFPNHLEEMDKLLRDVDFGNLIQTEVIDGDLYAHPGNLSDDKIIHKMLNMKFNFFGPTVCGYKLSAYKNLAIGWSPAPDEVWTDLFMWRKFLSEKELKFGSRMAVTSLHFATSLRKEYSSKDRGNELRNWSMKIKSFVERDLISQHILKKHICGESNKHTNAQISVIIPIYNGIKYLRTAINSVISQTMAPCELILVDDGSLDDSIKSIEDMSAHFPIRIIKQMNAGQSAARNHGAKLAIGEYLAFLDQDDLWYPDHLKNLIEPFYKIWNLGWVYSNLDEIDEDGRVIQIGMLDIVRKENPKKSIAKMLSDDMFILPSASLILKQAFHEVGGFDERLCGYEDDDLFVRLFETGWKNSYIPESLSQWRIYSNSTSYSEKMEISRMIYTRKLLGKYPDKPIVNKYWAKEYILPRFLNITIQSYLFYCIKIKDFNRCNKLLIQLREYIAMLPEQNQKKWKRLIILLRSPRFCYFLWDKIIYKLPLSMRNMIRNYIS